jgi:glucosyl-3-phosphoglycerate synthase
MMGYMVAPAITSDPPTVNAREDAPMSGDHTGDHGVSSRRGPGGPRTYHHADFPVARLLEAKGDRTVSVCIPARDEGSTVGSVVRAVVQPFLASAGGNGLVDEVLVLNDGSIDDTAEQARAAGARVVSSRGVDGGKGQAMAAALEASAGDIIVYLDADVANTTPAFVTGMLGPLLLHLDVALVKGFYTRPLHGEPTGGGRVTELVARPVLELLFPELSEIRQPLAGETAAHRWVFEKVGFADGYGVEIALLIDVATHIGPGVLAQVDLGERIHRNRPLHELRPQAVDVLRAALDRIRP